jgi:hypothetical protein
MDVCREDLMKLTRRVLIPLCAFAIGIVLLFPDRPFSQTEKREIVETIQSQSAEQSTEKGYVIGHLQTRDKVVTITRGEKATLYTVKTKDGKMLAENLSEKALETKYPMVFQQIKYGRAGNDATLHKVSIPLIK